MAPTGHLPSLERRLGLSEGISKVRIPIAVECCDLMSYKRKDDDFRAKVMDQLTAEAQESGMGY